MRFIPSSQDKWLATDKTAHFGLWFFFASIGIKLDWPCWANAMVWGNVGLLWEYWDGINLFIWNDARGFSWRDLVMDGLGILVAILLWR